MTRCSHVRWPRALGRALAPPASGPTASVALKSIRKSADLQLRPHGARGGRRRRAHGTVTHDAAGRIRGHFIDADVSRGTVTLERHSAAPFAVFSLTLNCCR